MHRKISSNTYIITYIPTVLKLTTPISDYNGYKTPSYLYSPKYQLLTTVVVHQHPKLTKLNFQAIKQMILKYRRNPLTKKPVHINARFQHVYASLHQVCPCKVALSCNYYS